MKKTYFFKNQFILLLVGSYIAIILFFTAFACYMGYRLTRNELLSDLNVTLVRAANEYGNLTNDFWNIYMPLFESTTDSLGTLRGYFLNSDTDLTPLQKNDLARVLSQMAMRDDRVRWVAIISEDRETNYAWFPIQDTLQPLGEDFPYWPELEAKQKVMEIYGTKAVPVLGESMDCIAMAGGLPFGVGKGSIVAGFSVDTLRQICTAKTAFTSLQFDIVQNARLLFSSGAEPFLLEDGGVEHDSGQQPDPSGIKRYYQVYQQDDKDAQIYYSVRNDELFFLSNAWTGILLLSALGLLLLTMIFYTITLRMLGREVDIIRDGLEKIGQKKLDTRIQTDFHQGGFAEIAEAINTMTDSLKTNIDRAYYYELKQKEAEMQELQSKFNPHFLYNSLEMFCARCYQNGDEETAELIAQTAAIFRGFIGNRTFIPLREELAFSKRYLSLFRARYGDRVRVLYDFDSEVLDYGIIRNTFQPLIENYFVHGIDTIRDDNYICIHGHIRDEDTILITVEDNGAGMTEEALQQLNKRLEGPIGTEKESYGLKNLHQRLSLFYGEGCGLHFCHGPNGGLQVDIVIKRMRCPNPAPTTE